HRAHRWTRRNAEEVLSRERTHPAPARQPHDAPDDLRSLQRPGTGRGRRRDAQVLTRSTATMAKQSNFTILPDDPADPAESKRDYANFCAVAHTPCDLTLTFCDVRPLSERDIQQAEVSRTVR